MNFAEAWLRAIGASAGSLIFAALFFAAGISDLGYALSAVSGLGFLGCLLAVVELKPKRQA